MWSDIVLGAERQHLLRLFVWSALSLVGGTAVFTLIAVRRARSPLLTHFAIQMLAWGAVLGAIAYAAWSGLHLRDVGGAARLERIAWFKIGLDAGVTGIGVTLAVAGHVLGRRLAVIGAGAAITLQGLALFLLDLQFASLVSR